MRIGIDCRIVGSKPSGMGRYASGLVRNLTLLDQGNEYIIFINSDNSIFKFIAEAKNFRLRLLKSPTFSAREQIELPWALRGERIDLFHSLSFSMPVIQPCRSIMTIYDLIHLLFPNNYSKGLALYYRTVVASCVRKVDRIITTSYNSKNDIISLLKVPEEKISVVYGAADEHFKPLTDFHIMDKLREKYGITSRFILYVGNMRPHKNLRELLEAFHQTRCQGLDFILVICGERIYSFSEIQKRAMALNIGKDVIFTGIVSDEDLVLLYNAARALILPSMYEGFGLPPLEAMACGTPVIASRVASLPEVLAEAAILVEAGDISGLSRAISEIITDNPLREGLSRKGIDRNSLFSWQDTTKKTLAIYKQVINNKYNFEEREKV